MKQLIYNIIRFISKKMNVNIACVIAGKFRILKTQWIAGKLAEAGKGCSFHSVAQLYNPQFIHIGDNNGFGKDLYLTVWGGIKLILN